MAQTAGVIALVGSYRKGGITDSLVDEVLAAVADSGTAVRKVYLSELQIAFCRNCRRCTQSPGAARGVCDLQDEMAALLALCDRADGLILAAPINFFTVTALTKRFVERLVCCAYWPWGQWTPKLRDTRRRPALLVTSCAMPAPLARLTTNSLRVLKSAAAALGTRPIASQIVGLVAQSEHQALPEGARRRARRLGRKLAAGLHR